MAKESATEEKEKKSMALTRRYLSTLGIEEDKVDEIILKHSETVTGLKDERDAFKEKAEKYDKVEKELNALKKGSNSDDKYKLKYESIKEEFDNYKKDIEEKKTIANKEKAYAELLKEANIQEKRIPSIIKISKDILSEIEFDDDGKIKNYDKLKTEAESEWEDFRVVESKKGSQTPNPPSNNGTKTTMTVAEIRKIKDPIERQKKMLENRSLFGMKGE